MSFNDFPEPKSFNGDEDDRQIGFYGRHSGPRPELTVCYECGHELEHQPMWVGWLGPFCSRECADRGAERHAVASDPRRI